MSKAPAQKSAALPEPATIYVLWHPPRDPADDAAEFYAHAIFSWFRMKSGYGAPVYFRSTAAAGRDGKPLDILPPAEGAVNLIIVLANAEMVADHAWREWLDELANRKNFLLFPVALDSTAYNLPESMRELNFIPVQLAAGRGSQFATDDREQGRERLLKQLTEAFARVLTRDETDPAALPSESKVRVFLSHAKADDTEQARSLRDYIYSETQLSAFFDENDIAFGNSFQKVLDKALRQGETAALAVFHGDNYADRPWCRREIQVFRKPVKVKGTGCVWMLHPMIVLQTMKGGISGGVGLGRTIAELGSATCIRWQERNEATYVTSLLREVFLGARHLKMAIEVRRRLRRMNPGRIAKGCALINWTPDLPTLLRLGEIIRGEVGGVPLSRVIYPGHGLSRLELDTLRLYFPKLELLTFTEVLS